MNRVVWMVMLLVSVGGHAFASDQVVKSRDGGCQISVPAGWTITAMLASASSANKQVTATVSSPKMVDSFAELKQTAQGVYKNSKVTRDSATEFEMEGKSITDVPDVYRAIPVSANKFCIVEVMYKSGPADDARKIAETLKAAK